MPRFFTDYEGAGKGSTPPATVATLLHSPTCERSQPPHCDFKDAKCSNVADVAAPSALSGWGDGDREERAAIMEFCGELPRQEAERLAFDIVASAASVPAEEPGSSPPARQPQPTVWRDSIEALRRTLSPRGITADWWGDLQVASISFLDAWGHKAADQGWTAPQLFGLAPAAPYERIGAWGLCPMLCGTRRRTLVELHNSHAVMLAHGHHQRYRRKPLPRSVPFWELAR